MRTVRMELIDLAIGLGRMLFWIVVLGGSFIWANWPRFKREHKRLLRQQQLYKTAAAKRPPSY